MVLCHLEAQRLNCLKGNAVHLSSPSAFPSKRLRWSAGVSNYRSGSGSNGNHIGPNGANTSGMIM